VKRFRPIVLVADIVCVLTIAFLGSAMPAQAKQCHAARPSNAQSYWSYRLIDGRKCWYEGRPGFSKSLLQWSAAQTAEKAEKNTRREPDARPASTASKYNPLDAQASITSDAEAKTNPETADRIAAPSKGNLNSDDLRAWGNTKMATAGEPVLKIMDRWPDEELRQHRNAPVPAAQSSGMGGRTILMVVIIFMALSAVLMTTFRKANGRWRFPFWPGRTSRRQTAAWY
jgi:acyl transferase domain-containing protein